MSLFNTMTFAGKRFPVATRVKGRTVESTPVALSLTGSLQPTQGNLLKALPEGKRSYSAFTIYTETELKVADDVTGVPSDIVVIAGLDYEVSLVYPWQNGILSHYQVVCTRKPNGAVR